MKPRYSILLPAAALGLAFTLVAESNSAITQIKKLPAGPAEIVTTLPEGTFYRIEASNDLQTWQALYTLKSTGTGDTFTDTASTGQPRRFFRSIPLEGTNWVTGEHIPTADGDIVIHPIVHASFVMQWNGKIIYCDPAGDSAVPGSATTLYADLPKADLVLYTHAHGDHWNSTVLNNILKPNGSIVVAPQSLTTSMNDTQRALTTILPNGNTTSQAGVAIKAEPAYNNTSASANFHRQGQ